MKLATERLPSLPTPRSAALLAEALRKSSGLDQSTPPTAQAKPGERSTRANSAKLPLAVILAALAAGCQGEEKSEEEPEEPQAPQVEEPAEEPAPPIPPETPVVCDPQITCVDPPVSNEAGFARMKVGVDLGNSGCWLPGAGKDAWLAASPAYRRVVDENGERLEPNLTEDGMLPPGTEPIPVRPTALELERDLIRRVITAVTGAGDSYLVSFQTSDVEVDAACRNHQARVANGDIARVPVLPLNTCFKCLTEDTRACETQDPAVAGGTPMTAGERDYCVCRYHPSNEQVTVQVNSPLAPSTEIPACDDQSPPPEPEEPEEGTGEQSRVRKIVSDMLAQFNAREEGRAEFRRFVEKKAA